MSDPTIYVLAGVNGSGKSSIGGAAMVARGVHYYNPDTAAQELRQIHPNMKDLRGTGYLYHSESFAVPLAKLWEL